VTITNLEKFDRIHRDMPVFPKFGRSDNCLAIFFVSPFYTKTKSIITADYVNLRFGIDGPNLMPSISYYGDVDNYYPMGTERESKRSYFSHPVGFLYTISIHTRQELRVTKNKNFLIEDFFTRHTHLSFTLHEGEVIESCLQINRPAFDNDVGCDEPRRDKYETFLRHNPFYRPRRIKARIPGLVEEDIREMVMKAYESYSKRHPKVFLHDTLCEIFRSVGNGNIAASMQELFLAEDVVIQFLARELQDQKFNGTWGLCTLIAGRNANGEEIENGAGMYIFTGDEKQFISFKPTSSVGHIFSAQVIRGTSKYSFSFLGCEDLKGAGPSFLAYLEPFDVEVWIGFLSLFCTLALILPLFFKYLNVKDTIFPVLASLSLEQGVPYTSKLGKSLAFNIVLMFLAFVFIIFTNGYKSLVITNMLKPPPVTEIKSFDEAAHSNLSFIPNDYDFLKIKMKTEGSSIFTLLGWLTGSDWLTTAGSVVDSMFVSNWANTTEQQYLFLSNLLRDLLCKFQGSFHSDRYEVDYGEKDIRSNLSGR